MRVAGKQQAAAGRCEREQMGHVANAAHEEQPVNSYQLRRACPEVQELYSNTLGIQKQLSWALGGGDGADAIEYHHQALLSKVRRIEGAAFQEALARGWDLIEIQDLVQGMLGSGKCMLREADSTLYKLKAAHHDARVEDLAGKASEVLDGTTCWSRRDCTEFSKELDWELQAFGKANTELEQPSMPTVKRQAAQLRGKKAGATAH
jgi:hypothetical protein